MMNAGPAGFRGAPLSKALSIATLAGSVAVQAAARTARRRLPRLLAAFSHAFVFRHPGELLFGSALIYYFRLFERQLGTAKFGAFALVSCGLGYALEAALSAATGRASAGGLYPLIFACLVPFALDVPALQTFSVFGLGMTDKAFIYLGATQLLLASGRRSLAAGACGVAAGLLYRLDVLGLRRLRLPTAVEELVSATIGRVLTGPTQAQQVFVTPHQPPTQPPGAPGGRAAAGGGGGGAPLPAPSPEGVQQLVEMGFDAASAAQALQQASNNVETALQLLL